MPCCLDLSVIYQHRGTIMYDFNVVSENYDADTVTVQISCIDLDLLIGECNKKSGRALGRNSLNDAMHYQKEAAKLKELQDRMLESVKAKNRRSK